jgi:hypothetical protein
MIQVPQNENEGGKCGRNPYFSDGSSTVADQKENLKLFNWLKSLKAT